MRADRKRPLRTSRHSNGHNANCHKAQQQCQYSQRNRVVSAFRMPLSRTNVDTGVTLLLCFRSVDLRFCRRLPSVYDRRELFGGGSFSVNVSDSFTSSSCVFPAASGYGNVWPATTNRAESTAFADRTSRGGKQIKWRIPLRRKPNS